MITEEWRQVVGYEGVYEVSNFGNVVRVKDRWSGKRRQLKAVVTKDGYRNVRLSKNNIVELFGIHRLVAAAFIGPKPPGLEVNHKNGIKHDNSPANLEYVTRSENCAHAYRVLGRQRLFGEANHKSRVSSDDISAARLMLKNGAPKREVAKAFGHHLCWAYRIANGQTRLNG